VDTLYVSPQLRSLEFDVIPISEGICGADHKALLIRIPKSILGMGHLPQQQYRGRQLKIQDPHIQTRYNKELKKQCLQNQLLQRASALWQETAPGCQLTLQQQIEYEEIDQLKVQAMQHAEQRCRKLRMGEVAWSPAIAASRTRIAMWSALIKARSGKKISSQLIRRLMAKAHYTSGKLVVDVIFTQSRRKYIVFQTFPSRFGNSVTLLIHIRRNNSDDL